MRPLSALDATEARRLHGLVFDLDGTVLSGGRLSLEAYAALHTLGAHGLRLVACTGRPAGWGAVLARQWPIDLAVAENGAIAFRTVGTRLETMERLTPDSRTIRRRELAAIVAELRELFPGVPLADDNPERRTDVTFDVRETVAIDAMTVEALCRAAVCRGARTFESSIHVHVTLDEDDKASGVVRVISAAFDEDPAEVRGRYAFVGDSANDAPCFAAFETTCAVANIAPWVPSLSVPPRYVTLASEGAGFAELAKHLIAARTPA